MKRTEMATIQFYRGLHEVRLEMHVCWPWQNTIDRFV